MYSTMESFTGHAYTTIYNPLLLPASQLLLQVHTTEAFAYNHKYAAL